MKHRIAANTPTSSPDLKGQRILFVGGRPQHVCHIRRMVEKLNGRFASHDGGVEDSLSRLSSLTQRADLVFFPVDCISHAAHDMLKDVCRRCDTPFLPLRSSGAAGFARELDRVAGKGGIPAGAC